jgi:rubrerythrin/uncharacterized membrane protein
MKQWQCKICGYIHKGDEPPESCPVCGADRSHFVLLDQEDAAAPEVTAGAEAAVEAAGPRRCTVCGLLIKETPPPETCPVCGAEEKLFAAVTAAGDDAEPPDAAADVPAALRRWRCTVCNYVHTGAEPPETCPVCGADRSKFVLLPVEETPPAAEPPSPEAAPAADAEAPPSPSPENRERLYALVTDLMAKQHAHPISVHIPNGVLPVAVFFLFLGVLFDSHGLRQAAFYNLLFVLIAMPMVLFSGVNDWRIRFGGRMTQVFRVKMLCGAVVTLLCLVLVLWRLFDPDVADAGSTGRWLFLLIHLVALGAAVVAGYFGGKLVVFPGD